uniref:Reverse transcriptase/retrotransposon-derived protein RNase H-like domain-containing protein n=1 Tax=Amphimedon queenslandica TaxID=400682 RepID=A0A1X7V9Y1_AMPQE
MQVHYLGLIISAAGVQPDESKIEAVSCYPRLSSEKQLRQSHHSLNYYLKKVKHCLTSYPTLAFSDLTKELTLYTDASDVALGAALNQTLQGRKRDVSYFSHQLQKVERRHCTIERKTPISMAFH